MLNQTRTFYCQLYYEPDRERTVSIILSRPDRTGRTRSEELISDLLHQTDSYRFTRQ